MTEWKPFFALLPRRVDGRWHWLRWLEARYDDSDYIGGFYGGPYTPRRELRLRA